MAQRPDEDQTRAGDLAQLVNEKGQSYLIRLKPGHQEHTHNGVLLHDDLIGVQWGSEAYSHTRKRFLLLQPALEVLLLKTRRKTQILFPKDIGFVVIKMGIGPGQRILEAGTGSGAFTSALAFLVGEHGHVFSYEARPEMSELASQNLEKLGLSSRVTFKVRDIAEGFDETGVDAVFLDLPDPENYVTQAQEAVKAGGFLGCIIPTANQVSRLLETLHRGDFACIDVCEVLLRFYKTTPERVRPMDRMIGHTGFLVFARRIVPPTEPS